jgi:hypothetical protein
MIKERTVLTRKRRGPPATGKGLLIGTRFQPAEVRSLDEWRGAQDHATSRPEAIRRLVAHGLAWSESLTSGQASKRTTSRAHGNEFASAAAGERVDKAQAHEKPGTGRGKRKRALTEIPTELLEKPASRTRRGK